jgi:hypothetical protein
LRALASNWERVWPVASEIRQGVFSELESHTFRRDLTQRSKGDSSHPATANIKQHNATNRARASIRIGNGGKAQASHIGKHWGAYQPPVVFLHKGQEAMRAKTFTKKGL